MEKKNLPTEQAGEVFADSADARAQLSRTELGSRTEDPPEDEDLTFELDSSEEELLEEFGVLMAAEYNYGVTRVNGQSVLPPDVAIDYRHTSEVPQISKVVDKAVEQVQRTTHETTKTSENKPSKL